MPGNTVKSIPISNNNYCGKTLIFKVLQIGKKNIILLLGLVDTKAIVVF